MKHLEYELIPEVEEAKIFSIANISADANTQSIHKDRGKMLSLLLFTSCITSIFLLTFNAMYLGFTQNYSWDESKIFNISGDSQIFYQLGDFEQLASIYSPKAIIEIPPGIKKDYAGSKKKFKQRTVTYLLESIRSLSDSSIFRLPTTGTVNNNNNENFQPVNYFLVQQSSETYRPISLQVGVSFLTGVDSNNTECTIEVPKHIYQAFTAGYKIIYEWQIFNYNVLFDSLIGCNSLSDVANSEKKISKIFPRKKSLWNLSFLESKIQIFLDELLNNYGSFTDIKKEKMASYLNVLSAALNLAGSNLRYADTYSSMPTLVGDTNTVVSIMFKYNYDGISVDGSQLNQYCMGEVTFSLILKFYDPEVNEIKMVLPVLDSDDCSAVLSLCNSNGTLTYAENAVSEYHSAVNTMLLDKAYDLFASDPTD